MNQYDFGYSWPWTYGHLVIAVVFAFVGSVAFRLKWRRWITALAAVVTLWAVGAFLVLHYRFNLSSPMEMPSARFLWVGDGPLSTPTVTITHPLSEYRSGGNGVLKLTLGDGVYSWQFVNTTNSQIQDSGSGVCH